MGNQVFPVCRKVQRKDIDLRNPLLKMSASWEPTVRAREEIEVHN